MSHAAQASNRREPTSDLDPVARTLVDLLQQDGRRSYAALAKEVGLSEAAVRQRVQRLLADEVMQIVAVTDPMQVGFRRQAMIGIRTSGDMAEVAKKLAEIQEIDYVVVTAGSFDILVEAVCEDDEHLLGLLSERIRAIPEVLSTEAFVYLKLVKQFYHWGTR